jgi:hypothetical protein
VVAGRVERDGHLGGRFAWVAAKSTSPVEFMKAALDDDGWTAESRVAFVADGADRLSNVVRDAIPQSPRQILNWFHISMRLRHIEQMGPKVADILEQAEGNIAGLIRLRNL